MGNDRAARGDKTCNDRVANRFGRCFDRKKERFDLEQLRAGDHIVEEKHFTYWHHMIVEEVDINQKQIHVIHYYNKKGPSGSGSSVCRSQFTYTKDKFYRIVYEDKECLPAPEVLEKAKARIGENHVMYNPFTNCEHFTNECKTGKKESHQVWTPIEILLKSLISTGVSCVVETCRTYRSTIDPWKEWLAKHDSSGYLAIALLVGIEAIATYNEGKLTLKEFAQLIIERFENKPHKSSAKFSPRLAIITAVIFEACLLCPDYYDAKAKLDEGKLTREEAYEVIVKRVCAAVCSIFGHGIGFLLGQLLKWSFLGPFWGGWVLPILGTIVVGAAGDYLAKVIAGVGLGELLTPLFIDFLIKEKSQ